MNPMLVFILGLLFGALISLSYDSEASCTVTIKDHQGVYHELKGKADE